jgi:ribosomal protein S18 acetylase RimI-like enzyme
MNTRDIDLRRADLDRDIALLTQIWFEASCKAHGFLGEARLREQRQLIAEKYLPMAETWVACRNEQPLGFISLLDCFVGGIFIAPAEQGQGLGRRLIDHALAQKGELCLEVYARNIRALKFYTGLGFTEMSRRPVDDEGLPFETIRMRLVRD